MHYCYWYWSIQKFTDIYKFLKTKSHFAYLGHSGDKKFLFFQTAALRAKTFYRVVS